MPTLLVGDFILVNKFTYGIRLPIVNKKVDRDRNSPQRGDVMVFRYPEDPSLDYIKRVVGLPGDAVAYRGQAALRSTAAEVEVQARRRVHCRRAACDVSAQQLIEKLGDARARDPRPARGAGRASAGVQQFPVPGELRLQ